jgi:uncharacterized membrane protein
MRVGRDHIASSIYTLVLAYAGAALPLFLLVALSTDPLSLTVNREFISEELIRTIVGTMGLLACVPLTTLLAALAAAGGGAGAGPADGEFRALLPGAASAVSAPDGSREGPA